MKNTNWQNVEASDGQPTKGGYVCRIVAVEDDETKEYLKVHMDIALGDFAGYYSNLHDRFGFYGLTHIRSYKETAKGLFKKFLTVIEESNNGFIADNFNNNPQSLVGYQIGAVLQFRRYTKKNGLDGTQLRVADICNTKDIIEGNFVVPDDVDDRTSSAPAPASFSNTPAGYPTGAGPHATTGNYGFNNIPDGLEDEGLPFH